MLFIYMSGLSRLKVRSYNGNDPRYNLHISDSYDLIKEIYPLHLQKECNNSDELKAFYEKTYPEIARCSWWQGYENCADFALNDKNANKLDGAIVGVDKMHGDNCICSICKLKIYDKVEDTISWKSKKAYAKNLTPNSFYDRTRIRKIENPNLEIRRTPDLTEYNNDIMKSTDTNRLIVENFDDGDNYVYIVLIVLIVLIVTVNILYK